ncbi:hypothetical protein [Paraburkholderia sp. HP33-1]|uniref:hypothetical protein n=1 Tax=Paraburkholderia sp. HP33-1 TaxID=2883243 RepID=UPI001F2F5827|nr:hypothetical protein [Paraburkholderia sp. HP33-1]
MSVNLLLTRFRGHDVGFGEQRLKTVDLLLVLDEQRLTLGFHAVQSLMIQNRTDDGLPFTAPTAAGQHANAELWADRIQDMSVTIDNKPVTNIKAYQVATRQFSFTVGGPHATLFTGPETR